MQDGFQGEDPFDAVAGLFGTLEVSLGRRSSGEPNDPCIRDVEGWILGRYERILGSTEFLPYSLIRTYST